MSNVGALDALARILGDAIAPLADRLRGDQAQQTLADLGVALPAGAGAVGQALEASATACSQLPDAVQELVDAAGGGDDAALIAASLDIGQLIVRAGVAFAQLGDALHAVAQADATLTAPQKARLQATLDELPDRLLHLGLIAYVEDRQPAVKSTLELAGLIDDIPVPDDPADPGQLAHRLREVRFDRLTKILTDPGALLQEVYGFGTPAFDGLELFERVKHLVDRPDATALVLQAPGVPTALEAWLFRLEVVPGAVPALGIRLRVPAEKNLDLALPIAGPWSATIESAARFEGGLELVVHPTEGLHIEPPTAQASLDLAFGVRAQNADGTPMIIVGQPGGSRLELQRFVLRVPVTLSADAGAGSATVDIGAEMRLEQGKVVIDGSSADGFLATLIGDLDIESAFDLGAAFDREGVHFTGSATIEVAIPTHLSLGPLEIPQIYLIGGFQDGAIPIEFSVDLGADLGPLQASVSRMGALATLSFPPGGGNAGVAQIDIGFKPPTGVGLSVDAGIVKGGGFLYIDVDQGEYAGALELVFSGILTIKAIGLITTRMPDGSEGFSLLIILSAEFGTPFQLGFGFTLNAVGGLLGLNRTMELERLAQGVRTGSVESVMFPEDIIANAPRIISDLREFFPPAQDRFLVGPMAKLGWGTPTLVTASIGLIVEIPPGNIAILGVLKVALPDEDAALIVIQVNFIGALEVDRKRLWFYAALFDSRVIFITLEGEMALLIAWGDDANFVLSVGGFHPSFDPPPLPFPEPKRIALTILNEPVALVRVSGYFAVTSNTAQFGALVEVRFGLSEFGISGHLGFDALFQFSPFYFIITISASLEVKVFGVGLFSVRMRGELEGTSPWHVEGEGSISVLFFDIDVPFSHTWGAREDTALPPIDVLPRIVAELEKPANWTAEPPAAANLLVSLRTPEQTEDLVLHPLGVLKVSQRAIPLDLDLDKVGNQRPADVHRVSLNVTGGGLAKRRDAEESFATGQFKDLDDAERLSAPAYERQHAGIELSVAGDQARSHSAVKRVLRYEEIVIDGNYRRHLPFFGLKADLFAHLLKGNAASRSGLSAQARRERAPVDQKITIAAPQYVVASNVDNTVHGASTFTSHAAAQDFLRAQVGTDAALAGNLHVIPAVEAQAA